MAIPGFTLAERIISGTVMGIFGSAYFVRAGHDLAFVGALMHSAAGVPAPASRRNDITAARQAEQTAGACFGDLVSIHLFGVAHILDAYQVSYGQAEQQLPTYLNCAEATMAIDVYLQIDGIKGESSDNKHLGWIECSSVHWGVTQPRSATASTGGGHTAERAELADITFTKHADLSSPILLQTCASGRTIPKAKLEFMRADGNGDRIKYFEIELENVLIGPDLHPGDILAEHVGRKYSKIKWRYTQQKISGGGGSTVGGWDLASNKIV